MNKLSGHIEDIKVSGSLSLVSVKMNEELSLNTIVIETPETAAYLKKGTVINVLFKETEVVIGTNKNHSISLQNRISGTIKEIEHGTLISKVTVDTPLGEIVSIISTNAISQLKLKEKIPVMAMVKLNEIMLSE